MEADLIPQQVEQTGEQTDTADLVVGILADFDAEAHARMFDALRGLPAPLRVAVVQRDHQEIPPSSSETAPASAHVFPVASPLAKLSGTAAGLPSMSAQYQSVFAAADKLQARACCIVASTLEMASPESTWQMARPLFENDVDLVLPHYARRKFEGLLNVGIIAPMLRALYGKRVNNPMGPDFGVSRRLFEKILAASGGTNSGNRPHPLASLTPVALCQNLQIIEVNLGPRVYPPMDWSTMSSVLADVLTPVFLDMERNASCWQRMRVSSPVPAIGTPFRLGEDGGTMDTTRMIESFQLGNRTR